MDDKIALAARNNADWCEIVCCAHGSPGVFADGMWINRGRVPRFYPNAQTIACNAPGQMERIEELVHEPMPAGWALKESFAALDLAPLGSRVLFESHWIWLSQERFKALTSVPLASQTRWEIVRSEDSLVEWEGAWRDANRDPNTERIFLPSLLKNADVAIVAGYRGECIVAGAIGNRSESVIGWSNFFAGGDEDERACASGSLATIARNFPNTAIVGYEEGGMLSLAESLGFERLGPLRVWVFNGR